MPGDRFTHLDDQGRAQMVDVMDKAETQRQEMKNGLSAVVERFEEAIRTGVKAVGIRGTIIKRSSPGTMFHSTCISTPILASNCILMALSWHIHS